MDGPSFEGDPGEGFAVRTYAYPRDATRTEGERLLDGEITRITQLVEQALGRTGAP